METPQIVKLYVSNFLTGLVFWYGIEKLFMSNIGINPVGIGVAVAVLTVLLVLLDIPAGIAADKWSRKAVLAMASIFLGLSSLVGGLSHGLALYLVCEIFYALYVVTTSGTYQSLVYDSLREEGRERDYSRINGRIFAFFLLGTGVGNLLSGLIAHRFDYQASYLISIIPCAANILIAVSMHEPRFHAEAHKEKLVHQVGQAIRSISRIHIVRNLTVIMTILAVVELFKLEFGQLYMLRYVTSTQIIGLLWAFYSIAMALGSLLAHRLKARIDVLIFFSIAPLIAMSFLDNWLSVGLFMVQAVAAAALFNQIETRIQDNTPSPVRTSVLSVVSTLGRIVAVPASFVLGWLFKDYSSLLALRFVAVVAGLAMVYWLMVRGKDPAADEAV